MKTTSLITSSTAPTRTSMRLYSNVTVYEESLKRLRYLFDEFEQVVVGFSGGKDSTVIFNLALIVAREKHRLPLSVMFIDQESELESTVTTVRRVMNHPDVSPRWYQIPFKLFNATSTVDHWLQCWNPDDEQSWMRPKEPNAITKNVYGTDRFSKLFERILSVDFSGVKACFLGGIRCEESPCRSMAMTQKLTYKALTWGKRYANPDHFAFYPIYDWSLSDVWKSIHDNAWEYSSHYDSMYRYGIPAGRMRVSSMIHETGVGNIAMLQEVDPDTYNKLTSRIQGIDMSAKMGREFFPANLPFMFNTWGEYRDHLLHKLIDNPQWKDRFRRTFKKQDDIYEEAFGASLKKVQISSILTNDWEGLKMHNWLTQVRRVRHRRVMNAHLATQA